MGEGAGGSGDTEDGAEGNGVLGGWTTGPPLGTMDADANGRPRGTAYEAASIRRGGAEGVMSEGIEGDDST